MYYFLITHINARKEVSQELSQARRIPFPTHRNEEKEIRSTVISQSGSFEISDKLQHMNRLGRVSCKAFLGKHYESTPFQIY